MISLLSQTKEGITTHITDESSYNNLVVRSYYTIPSTSTYLDTSPLQTFELASNEFVIKDYSIVKIPSLTSYKEGTAQDALDCVHAEAAKVLSGYRAMGIFN